MLLLTSAILLLAASNAAAKSLNCVFLEDYTIFDYSDLSVSSWNYNVSTADSTQTIYFNFCKTLTHEELEGVALLRDKETWTVLNRDSELESPNVHLVKTSNFRNRYLELRYTGDEGTSLQLNVICDRDFAESEANVTLLNDASLGPHYEIDIVSQNACYKTSLNDLWRFAGKNEWIFGIVFVVLGLFETFLGRRMFRPTLFLVGMLTTVAVLLLLFYVFFLPTETDEWIFWTVIGAAVVVGVLVGLLLAKLSRVGLFLIGCWGGAVLGLLLSEAVLYKTKSLFALWVPVVVLGALVGVLSFKWYKGIVIIATSILGAFLFVRGIAVFAGGYPNEFTIYTEIRDGAISSVPKSFYAYFGGMVALFIAGLIVQCRTKSKEQREKKGLGDYSQL